jgi:DNA-binding LacI/PurR family transcriptional regulator
MIDEQTIADIRRALQEAGLPADEVDETTLVRLAVSIEQAGERALMRWLNRHDTRAIRGPGTLTPPPSPPPP